MKIFFSLLLSLGLFTNTAFASSGHLLKNLIADYQYALTVEWDQQDERVREQMLENLSEDLVRLVNSGAVSASDLESLVKESGVNAQILRDLDTLLKTGYRPESPADSLRFLEQHREHLFAKGASWSMDPYTFFLSGLGVLLVAWLIIGTTTDLDETCTWVSSQGDTNYYTCEYDG